MNRLRAAAAIAALTAGVAAAKEAPELKLRVELECLDEACTMLAVPAEVMRALRDNTNLFSNENRELKQQLEKMRELKGCAKTEITEPSKAIKALPTIRGSGT